MARSNTNPELIGNNESKDASSLPGSAAGVAGLIPPNPDLMAGSESATNVATTNPLTSDRRGRVKPPQKSWWPIALLIAVVAGVVIVAVANAGRNERGNEPAPGSHGAEKLP